MNATNESRFGEGHFQKPIPNSAADLREKNMVANAAKHPGFEDTAQAVAKRHKVPIERARAIAAGAEKSRQLRNEYFA